MHIGISRAVKKPVDLNLMKHFPKSFEMDIFHWIARPLEQALGNAAPH